MEPSTPPRSSRSRDIPATPATPRFGSFGDLPDQPRKPRVSDAANESGHGPASAAVTPHRRKRSVNILATPRRTPKKRKEAEHPKKQALLEATPETYTESEPPRSLFPRLDAPESSSEKAQAEPESMPLHPHQDVPPPNVPGMWYVFRGKKIFRPLPPGEKPLEPVRLFADQIDFSRRRKADDLFQDESGSEADTDVEL